MVLTTPLQLSHSFPPLSSKPTPLPNRPTVTPRAEPIDSDAINAVETDGTSPEPDGFEGRLARIKYRSGTGKKAELRKARKAGAKSSSSKKGVLLPPVPLKEPFSGGRKVDFGFNPYTERLNGRLAGLGLAALLLVELGSGQSLVRYHSATVLFLQVYTVMAISAVFVKWEKERISVWPENKDSGA